MSNLTNDISALQTAIVDNFIQMVQEGAIFIGSFASMIYLQWKLTILCLVIVPLVSLTIKFFGKKLHTSGRSVQERLADVTSMLQETIQGVRIVRSFNRGDFEEGRFREINKSSFKATVRAIRQQSQMTPLVEFLSAIAVCAIIWYGGVSVIDGVMTTGELIAFLIYAINLANPTRRLAESFGNIQKSLAAADRVFAILDEKPEVQDRPGAKPLVVTEGRVEARHVQFAYEKDNPVLTDLNFVAEPGQTIAVVGPSGAGKTTIANLLPRFYDVTGGAILIDGAISEMSPSVPFATISALCRRIRFFSIRRSRTTSSTDASMHRMKTYGLQSEPLMPRKFIKGLRAASKRGRRQRPCPLRRPAPAYRHCARHPERPEDPHPR